MDFTRYLKIALRWWWLVLLCVALSATASYLYTQRQAKIYAAKATLVVGNRIVDTLNPDERLLRMSLTLSEVYGEMARRKIITQAVIDKLGLDLEPDVLGEMIQTAMIPNAQLLEIIVLDVHPQRAQLLANAVAEELILQTPGASQEQKQRENFINTQLAGLQAKIEDTDRRIKELEDNLGNLTSAVEIDEAQSRLRQLETLKSDYQSSYTQFLDNRADVSPNQLELFEEATVPTFPISPNVKKNVGIAGAAGLALAVGAILIIEFFNDILVWRRGATQSLLGLSILGTVGKTITDTTTIVAQDTLWSPEADALRSLRNSIFLTTDKQSLSTLLVTSAVPEEGKSFVAANLAATIASPTASAGAVIATPGSQTILVDADLRRPSLHEMFDMPNLLGLADVLAMPDATMERMLKKALRPTHIDGLLVLPAGRTPMDPGSLLNSPRFANLLSILSAEADLVIIDSAPLLAAIETKAMANVVDATLLVVRDGLSRSKVVQKAIDYFQSKPDHNLLGVVFNGVRLTRQYDDYAGYYTTQSRAAASPSLLKRLWPLGQSRQEDADVFTLTEVAEQLGISQDMARRWCEEGRLTATKQGRRWTVRLEDLNEFITKYQAHQVNENVDPVLSSAATMLSSLGNGQVKEEGQRDVEKMEQQV